MKLDSTALAALGLGVLALVSALGEAPPKLDPELRLGRHFRLREFTRSEAATRLHLDNSPPPAAVAALERLVVRVLDPLRDAVGPVEVSSGYRSLAVNEAVRGSPTSQHMAGEAADIRARGLTAPQLAARIVQLGLPFDEVVWYDPERGGHVHVSYTSTRALRRSVRRAPASGGYVQWTPPSASVPS